MPDPLNKKSYFRARYRKLKTGVRFFPGLRSDFKFAEDTGDTVFMLWPEFEHSPGNIIADRSEEAPDSGTAVFPQPAFPESQEYVEMLKERVKVGAKGYLVAGSEKLAEVEIIEVLHEPAEYGM
jgi:hypothetical protein